ncbi:dethiobiotin synthase [Ekhidna sp.]|jgi:dethiobiotin synthetase|uniref:dethiobiotin synthase n=1 Tax=Ekhidna sp. TaxID=2608089 RepID=UPI0032EB70FF
MNQKIIVAGIDTETGKTVASAILCQALKADYWKPVQAGDLENTDSHKVKRWVPETTIHPEAYQLTLPMSPHAAATIDNISIEESRLQIPTTENSLIIELAGGLMVPMREDYLNIDWVASTGLPVVLVSNYYLGSINHTLLSLYALKSRNIPLIGIIFNGDKNPSTFDVIMSRSNAKCLLEIEKEEAINEEVITRYANRIIH